MSELKQGIDIRDRGNVMADYLRELADKIAAGKPAAVCLSAYVEEGDKHSIYKCIAHADGMDPDELAKWVGHSAHAYQRALAYLHEAEVEKVTKGTEGPKEKPH